MAPEDSTSELKSSMDILEEGTADEKESPVPEEPEVQEDQGEGEAPEGETGAEIEEVEPEAEPEAVEGRHARPTVRQITTKYPSFFKEFPDMRHMLFREGEYSRIFPTVEDAKSASEDAQNFQHFASLVSSGKPDDFVSFLGGVKESKGLESMAANFLPALYKQDQNLYYRVTSPIGELLVRNAYMAATQAGNENLKNAALHLAQWAFGDLDYATGAKRSEEFKPEVKAKDPDLERERAEFYQTKYNDARGYVQTQSQNRLVGEIRKGLDPNNTLTPTMQNLLVKEILNEIGVMLEADQRHMAMMNSLWKQAHRAGFAGEWKDRILSTYLSRARQIMPAIRSNVRDGAFRAEEKESERKMELAQKSSERKEIPGSGRGSGNGKVLNAQNIDWSKTTDLDVLNDRITYKKG
jgi:hypothetical protein